MSFKSGFVTIIGRPNVGKSTLANAILGEKIAIMSDKPQTTRNRINAIYTDNDCQIVFMDTPGLHKPKTKLGDFMVKSALDTLSEVDVVVYMIDESEKIGPGDEFILDQLKGLKTPVILAVNKVDLISPETYVKIVEAYSQYDFIKEIISLSAVQNKNVDVLMKFIKGFMKPGPMYYPGDILTDQPEKAVVAEIIREKLLHYLDDEVPHGAAVEIERFKEKKNGGLIEIRASIICEKDSHKGIIIGKNGRKIKGIGMSAREDIEKLLGTQIFLELFVKVRPGWRDNDTFLKNYGYKKD